MLKTSASSCGIFPLSCLSLIFLSGNQSFIEGTLEATMTLSLLVIPEKTSLPCKVTSCVVEGTGELGDDTSQHYLKLFQVLEKEV